MCEGQLPILSYRRRISDSMWTICWWEKWSSPGHDRAIVGVELTSSSRVIVCYSYLCARSGGGRRMCWQPDGWLVGWLEWEISPIRTCKVMAKGRFFPQIVGPRVLQYHQTEGWRRFIAHRCSGEGEAFVFPADGVCQCKKIPQVFKRIIFRRCL
jgi:hypothetical protein